MAKRKKPAAVCPGPVVRWGDGSAGEVLRAHLAGDVLRFDLTRGADAVAAELTRLAPDFYAGIWAVTGFQPARGSANVTLTDEPGGTVRLAGAWFQGGAVVDWRAEGVRLG